MSTNALGVGAPGNTAPIGSDANPVQGQAAPVTSVFTPAAPSLAPVPAAPSPAATAGTGNAPKEAFLTGLLTPSSPDYLGGKYTGSRQAAGATLTAGLAGLGGYTIATNPDGTSSVSFDPSKAGTGDRETAAVGQTHAVDNAKGMLYSSFAQGDASAALQRLTEAGRGVVGKYAQDLNRINSQETTDWMDTVGSLAGLYGQDASWLAQNPPPASSPPYTPANATEPAAATIARTTPVVRPPTHLTPAQRVRVRGYQGLLARNDPRWSL